MKDRIYNPGGTDGHSVRVPDDVWYPAMDRAEAEDTSISHVIRTLLEGYGSGSLNLPTVTLVYDGWRDSEA